MRRTMTVVLGAVIILTSSLTGMALDGVRPQISIDAKFVEVRQAELDGMGVEWSFDWSAPWLQNIEAVSDWGSWLWTAGIDYTDLDDTSMIGVEGGARCRNDVTVMGTRVSVDAMLTAFLAQTQAYSIQSAREVVDRRCPDTGKVLASHVETQDEDVDSELYLGLSPRVGIEVPMKVPLLGDLPVIGRLFTGARIPLNKKELIIFVTVGIAVPLGAE